MARARRVPSICLVALGATISSSALAWAPTEPTVRPLPAGAATRVVLADLNGVPATVAVSAAGLTIAHAATGEVLASAPVGGSDVVVLDLDGDRWQDVVTCGASGIFRVSLVATGLAPPVRLSETPCSRLRAYQGEDGVQLLIADRDQLTRARVGPDGASLTPQPALTFAEPWLMATGRGGHAVALATGVIEEYFPSGVSRVAAGGTVGGVVEGPGGWTWTLPEAGIVADVSGRRVAVAPAPGSIAAGDLDGDGIDDVLIGHDGLGIGLLLSGHGVETVIPLSVEVGDLSVGDVDGDGCADIVFHAPGSPSVGLILGKCPSAASRPPPVVSARPPEEAAPPGVPVPADAYAPYGPRDRYLRSAQQGRIGGGLFLGGVVGLFAGAGLIVDGVDRGVPAEWALGGLVLGAGAIAFYVGPPVMLDAVRRGRLALEDLGIDAGYGDAEVVGWAVYAVGVLLWPAAIAAPVIASTALSRNAQLFQRFERDRRVELRVVPSVGPQGVGLGVSGTFP